MQRGAKLTEHIIIGTPGKVLDWSNIKFNFFDLKKIDVFVLDEADVMIAIQGHQDQSIRIHKNLRPDCQMLLFSATYDEVGIYLNKSDKAQQSEFIIPLISYFKLKNPPVASYNKLPLDKHQALSTFTPNLS